MVSVAVRSKSWRGVPNIPAFDEGHPARDKLAKLPYARSELAYLETSFAQVAQCSHRRRHLLWWSMASGVFWKW